jgi:hypothetical protein
MRNLIFFILISTASGIFITCDFNKTIYWPVVINVYACLVTSIDLFDNSTHITGVNGTHYIGNSNEDVTMVIIGPPSFQCSQSNLTTIPKGFLNFFPSLIALGTSTCSIDFLNGDELEEYPNLQWFLLRASNLTRVPGNFFASTTNMKFVDF